MTPVPETMLDSLFPEVDRCLLYQVIMTSTGVEAAPLIDLACDTTPPILLFCVHIAHLFLFPELSMQPLSLRGHF